MAKGERIGLFRSIATSRFPQYIMRKLLRYISALLCTALLFTCALPVLSTVQAKKNDSVSESDIAGIDAEITRLQSLIGSCRDKGISTDYEESALAVIILYRNRIAGYKETGVCENLDYTIGCLNGLYTDSVSSLEAYLNGSKAPKAAARYLSGALNISKDGIFASSSTGENKRTYLIGAGHGNVPEEEAALFSQLGLNIFQTEIGPNSIIVPRGSGDHTGLTDSDMFDISTSGIENTVVSALESARKNNIAVSLLISPHYMPNFLYELYPDLKNGNTGFQKYNINHPVAKRVLECFAKALFPYVNEYSDIILEICLANEAHYKTSLSEYDIPAWQEYLRSEFSDISELNRTLGTFYSRFEDCVMPVQNECTPLKYEWVVFNNAFYTDWFGWWSATVKKETSLPVSIKTMGYTDEASNRILYGVDIEDLAQHVDINCVDAWNIPFKKEWLDSKELAYDLARSTSELPLIDNEDHIIHDMSADFYDDEGARNFADHVYTDCWLGACHGRLAAVYWSWGNTFDAGNSTYGGLAMRPDAVAAMGRCSLDLSRLAQEVNAVSNTKAEAAILFSDTSRCYSRMNNDYVTMAYSALQQTGRAVKIVTEDSIANLENGLTLIIPNVCNIRSDALGKINEYALAGNKVILLGHCLNKDEYDKPSDAATLLSIYGNSKTIGEAPVSAFIYRLLRLFEAFRKIICLITGKEYVQSDLVTKNITGTLLSFPFPIMMDFTLADDLTGILGEKDTVLHNKTGKVISGCEWRVTEYNGNMLVMVCNTTLNDPVEGATLLCDGKQITDAVDLISGEAVGSTFTLEPYKPMLLCFSAE